MTSPPIPHPPKLPSRRVRATLATAMLAVGIALGALIGPGPAASLASSSRAAALGRVLALLALGEGTGSGSGLLLSSEAAHPPASAPQPTTSSNSEASGASNASGGAKSASPTSPHASASPSPSSRSVSPAPSTTPAGGGQSEGEGESEKTPKAKPLPPIADAWLIELPYGTSFENALKQSTAAPYLDTQLKREGTLLSGYSSLAAGQFAGAATLLSGQVGASVTTIAPPACVTAAQPSGSAGQPAPTEQPTPSGQPASSAQAAAGAPCPSGEPAGIQTADAFLREVVPTITASAPYREHGLIVIAFGGAQPGTAYPAGTLTSTLTAAGTPAGALLLSPFLRHPGTQSTSAFNPLAPRESLAGLLTQQHH